jgi:hypothetical protein
MKRDLVKRLIIACMLCTVLSANATTRCADLFGAVASRMGARTQFEQDFGRGVVIRKVSNQEFHIEPPPEVVRSVRQAQVAVGVRSKDGEQVFTAIFDGFSEAEVFAFRAMLHRDQTIKDDNALTAILLGEHPALGQRSYAEVHEVALAARDRMNRRYRWADARVEAQSATKGEREERYLLTVQRSAESDQFMLKLKLKVANVIRGRARQIASLLAKPALNDATAEQAAHQMLSDLKKGDPNVSAVSLKVLAGDFVIADAK